jgi:hypothetical protein
VDKHQIEQNLGRECALLTLAADRVYPEEQAARMGQRITQALSQSAAARATWRQFASVNIMPKLKDERLKVDLADAMSKGGEVQGVPGMEFWMGYYGALAEYH